MVSIGSLINNQKIFIDDHNKGTGHQLADWNDPKFDIHIHKENINKSDGGYTIKIPLNSNRKCSVEYTRKNNAPAKFPKKIRREISKALDNKEQREKFLNEICLRLGDFNWTRDAESERVIIEKVANAFDIPISRWETLDKQQVPSIVELSYNDKKVYEIILNYSQKKLIIGEFAPCNHTGIRKESYILWRNIILENLHKMPLHNIDILKGWLQQLSFQVPNIGKKTIQNTAEFLYNVYSKEHFPA